MGEIAGSVAYALGFLVGNLPIVLFVGGIVCAIWYFRRNPPT